MSKIKAPLNNLVYAISIHSGSGSMGEGFQSEGAMGFWTDPADAESAANALFAKIATAAPDFGQHGNVVVVAINQNMTTIDELFKSVIERFEN